VRDTVSLAHGRRSRGRGGLPAASSQMSQLPAATVQTPVDVATSQPPGDMPAICTAPEEGGLAIHRCKQQQQTVGDILFEHVSASGEARRTRVRPPPARLSLNTAAKQLYHRPVGSEGEALEGIGVVPPSLPYPAGEAAGCCMTNLEPLKG
jgi:hypothetical protein